MSSIPVVQLSKPFYHVLFCFPPNAHLPNVNQGKTSSHSELWVLMNYSLYITMKNRNMLTSAFQLLKIYVYTCTLAFTNILTKTTTIFFFMLTLFCCWATSSKLFRKWVCWRFDRFYLDFNWEKYALQQFFLFGSGWEGGVTMFGHTTNLTMYPQYLRMFP